MPKTTKKTTVRRTTARRTTVKLVAEKSTRRPMVGFLKSIANFWTGYFDFMGRSTRSEFWFGLLFVFVTNWFFTFAIRGTVATIVSAILFIPLMALTIRRFRDAGISVWWYILPALILYLIPIIRGAAWYRMLALNYVSSGMAMYSFCFLAFGIFELVVGCLPTKK